jgi:signal transduction histidine kinase
MTLAVLQYRWTSEASEATAVRLADALQLSMINWHLDFFRNLSEVCLTMRIAPDGDALEESDRYAQKLVEWRSIARYPDLVSNVYVLQMTGSGLLRTRRLDGPRGVFAESPTPAQFGELGPDLVQAAAPAASAASGRQFTESFYNIGEALRDWRFEPSIPALIRPLARAPSHSDEASGASAPQGWVLVELNSAVISAHILPDLAQRYFQGTDGLDFDVAVVAGATPTHVIYSSNPVFGGHPVVDADGRMEVFGRSADPTSESAVYVFHQTSENRGPTAAAGITWFPLLRHFSSDQAWHLVVRHRRGGPLGSFVAETRRRNLAIGFGGLLLLVASMTMLVVTSHRAQRLGRLQVDFVTAVSHQLRTPLAIIGSAADNLANGVVDNLTRTREYGTVIGTEVEHLSGLIEDILHFAAAREGQQRYTLAMLRVEDLIEATLTSSGALVRASQFTVEREIEAGLPPVKADPIGLPQCLGNLVTNALKYAKDQRWIKIRARLVKQDDGPGEVQVSVSDRGPGIDARDLPHIFEPFYRSESVRIAQIQGTGLGLAVAKQIAEAMGGALTVASTPGQGSTFTLHLALAESSAAPTISADVDASPQSWSA